MKDLIQQLRSEPRTKLCDEAAYALEKLQSELAASKPTVRKLEWERGIAKVFFGNYWLHYHDGGVDAMLFCNGNRSVIHDVDPERAKAACQADFESRVLSCLEPCPTPTATP